MDELELRHLYNNLLNSNNITYVASLLGLGGINTSSQPTPPPNTFTMSQSCPETPIHISDASSQPTLPPNTFTMSQSCPETPIHPMDEGYSNLEPTKIPRTFTLHPFPPIFRLNADLGEFEMMRQACLQNSSDVVDRNHAQKMIARCLLAKSRIKELRSDMIENIEARRRLWLLIIHPEIQVADENIAGPGRLEQLDFEWEHLIDRFLAIRNSYHDDLVAVETCLLDVGWQRVIFQNTWKRR